MLPPCAESRCGRGGHGMLLGDREQAKALLVELDILQPAIGKSDQGSAVKTAPPDPIVAIAKQKGVTSVSLQAYGAEVITPNTIHLPAYGPGGSQCTHFSMTTCGGKGKFTAGKPAGLFFPHQDGKVRLPKPGETWHLVEGPKDAAAMHELDFLSCGLNMCRLAAKFSRLFKDVEVILVPARDRAGEEGAQYSARVLHGMASSVRVAVLPAEFKESGGEDVRDVLRRSDGRELVLQAVADAKPSETGGGPGDGEENNVSAEIPLTEGDPLTLTVSSTFGKPQRLVVARRAEISHRDQINTDSSISRDRFVKRLASKFGIEVKILSPLVDPRITALADQVVGQAKDSVGGDGGNMPSQATLTANMAADWELWHTPVKDGYATFPVGEHLENWPIRSRMFKRFRHQRKAVSAVFVDRALHEVIWEEGRRSQSLRHLGIEGQLPSDNLPANLGDLLAVLYSIQWDC